MARSSRGKKPRRTRVLSKRVKQRTRGKARPRRTAQKGASAPLLWSMHKAGLDRAGTFTISNNSQNDGIT